MAQPITCDMGCGTLAQILWTQIETGDVQAYCAPCLADICAAVAQQAGLIDGLVAEKLAELEKAGVIREVKKRKPATDAPEPETTPADVDQAPEQATEEPDGQAV